MRLLILGLDNAGKTTVVKRFNGEDTSEIAPTLGFNIVTLSYRDFKLTCWDIGGQKSIRAFWRNYFEQTDGLVWVVDSADMERLRDCRDELLKLLQEERLAGATLLVFANKQDLQGAATVMQIAEVCGALCSCFFFFAWHLQLRQVLELARVQKRHWKIQPCVRFKPFCSCFLRCASRSSFCCRCSAYTGEGLEEGMEFIVDDIAGRIFSAD